MKTSGEHTTRRGFLARVFLAWSAMTVLPVVYGVVRYIIPPAIKRKLLEGFRIAKFGDISSDAPTILRVNKSAIILVRGPHGQIKAFSAKCTHLGCVVQYQSDRKVFHCNCHGSEFDLDGKNISGPAPKPLVPYRVELKNDDVIISEI